MSLTNKAYVLGSGHSRKRAKRTQTPLIRPMTFGRLNVSLGKPKLKTIKILCNSGATATILSKKFVKNLRTKQDSVQTWETPAGTFETHSKCKVDFTMPEFHPKRLITYKVHVTPQPMGYDMILGTDLLRELGFILDFKEETITWDDATLPMKPRDAEPPDFYSLSDEVEGEEASDCIKEILDAKYKPADLKEVVGQQNHLTKEEQHQLLTLLRKHEKLFDGTLGSWNDPDYNIELKEGVTPYHARPIPYAKHMRKNS